MNCATKSSAKLRSLSVWSSLESFAENLETSQSRGCASHEIEFTIKSNVKTRLLSVWRTSCFLWETESNSPTKDPRSSGTWFTHFYILLPPPTWNFPKPIEMLKKLSWLFRFTVRNQEESFKVIAKMPLLLILPVSLPFINEFVQKEWFQCARASTSLLRCWDGVVIKLSGLWETARWMSWCVVMV